MKKIFLLTLVFIFTASFSFAQFPGESFKQITGTVEKLKIGKPSKGSKPQIVVKDENGKEMALVIDPEATFYDAEFYPVTLEEIKVDDRVNIRYDITDDGKNNATWFNILE
jgi:hypothetical protein